MQMPDRRMFLNTSLAGGASALFLPSSTAIEPIQRTGRAPLRLSLAGYSCRDYLTGKLQPAMSYEQFIDCAADWGFDAVELTSYFFKETTPAHLASLKGRCTRLGLDISGGAVGNNFCERDPDKLRKEIDDVKQWIGHYSRLGAKTIRIFAGRLGAEDNPEAARRRCLESIRECCDFAGQSGIYLVLENHGGITATVDELVSLVKDVQHEWFGVNLDTGHFHSADPYKDLRRVVPYALSVQMKTLIHPSGQDHEADLGRLVGILRDANYRGYVVLEYEAKEDPKTAVPRYAAELRRLLES